MCNPPPKLAFVDMDGTLLSVSSEKLFLEHLVRVRLLSPGSFALFGFGYAAHPVRTLREGKGWNRRYLKGLVADDVEREAKLFTGEVLRSRIRPAVSDIMGSLSGGGCRVIVVTASLSFLAGPVAEAMAADGVIASVPEEENGRLTGQLSGPRPWGRDKSSLARKICQHRETDPSDCIALGDSWPDRHLMLMCGRAMAVHPSKRLRRLAQERGWKILEGRHTRWA